MTLSGVIAPLPENAPPETIVACTTESRGRFESILLTLGSLQGMAPSGRTLENEALHQAAVEEAKLNPKPQPAKK